ncbi:helix-turn-helix domain-containing protein [Nocardioides sp. W7]|uniref:PucR family transcriptional regulator n=1 Tax=Nocardioides sp. W7 TaxID=2931390 RepID=UPI001FD0FF30|nr:helix-turn-helix domain-containing protein [Nocardioides sp. W7]
MTAPDPPSSLQPSTDAMRPCLDAMVQRVVNDVVAAMPSYAAAPGSPRHQLLTWAAHTAAQHFLDDAEDPPSRSGQVDDLFRRLGQGEAQREHDWTAIEASLRIASRASWAQLTDFATTHDLTRPELQGLADALFDYLEHLREQLADGFALGRRGGSHTREGARNRLFQLFLADRPSRPDPQVPAGIDNETLHTLAEIAEWPLTETVTALAISYHGEPPALPESPTLLIRTQPRRALIICPAEEHTDLVERIGRSRPGLRTAVSWPVPPALAGSALRWCQRALDLVQLGVIAPVSVIDCATQATQLWLHAEPSMRQHLCQELLRPLLAETPHSRAILSETLLTWVETRDSAPVIAARLDLHPQTIRYRWKRINELFGEDLRDPEFVLRMTLVLKSSVPLWKAGDQSDFDTFRDRAAAGR